MATRKTARGSNAPSKRLPEALREPIYPDSPPPSEPTALEQLAVPESVARHKKLFKKYLQSIAGEVMLKRHKKLLALADHYGIDPGGEEPWLALAGKLADDYIPGFEVKLKKKEKLGKWSDMRLAKLYCSVILKNKDLEERGNTKSIAAACSVLSKSGYWKGEGDGKTLNNKFNDAKKTSLVRMLDRLADNPKYGPSVYKNFLRQMTGDVGEMRQFE